MGEEGVDIEVKGWVASETITAHPSDMVSLGR
jgi:hypothetical protein